MEEIERRFPQQTTLVEAIPTSYFDRPKRWLAILLFILVADGVFWVWFISTYYGGLNSGSFSKAIASHTLMFWWVVGGIAIAAAYWTKISVNMRSMRNMYKRSKFPFSPFVLYLRSFGVDRDDHSLIPASTDERRMARVFRNTMMSCIALDNVEDKGLSAGVLRLSTNHDSWRGVVEILSRGAHCVLVDCRVRTPGLLEEIASHLSPEEERCKFCLFFVNEVSRKVNYVPLDVHAIAAEQGLVVANSNPVSERTVGYVRDGNQLFEIAIPPEINRTWALEHFAELALEGTAFSKFHNAATQCR
ncbi:MAG: hypothetical protein R3B98_06695 [Hyphomonas sp.]